MIVKAELKCKYCKKTNEYSSTEIQFDHVICKSCGKNIGVVKWVDATNVDYINIKGTVHRRNPKVNMSKKDRRRMKNE